MVITATSRNTEHMVVICEPRILFSSCHKTPRRDSVCRGGAHMYLGLACLSLEYAFPVFVWSGSYLNFGKFKGYLLDGVGIDLGVNYGDDCCLLFSSLLIF